MISTVTILSKMGFIAMKDYTGPVHVDVCVLKIVSQKKDILDVRDDYTPISTKDFKDTIKSSFAEGREGNTRQALQAG
jgi:hypothetical protein